MTELNVREHRQGGYIQARQARLQPPNATIPITRVKWWDKILNVFQRIERGFKSTSSQQVKSNFRLSTNGQAVMKYSR